MLVWEGHARDLTLEERGGVAVAAHAAAGRPAGLLHARPLRSVHPARARHAGDRRHLGGDLQRLGLRLRPRPRSMRCSTTAPTSAPRCATRATTCSRVTELKKRRKHSDWPKTYRAALAFALWGDPTARPALPVQPPKCRRREWRPSGAAPRPRDSEAPARTRPASADTRPSRCRAQCSAASSCATATSRERDDQGALLRRRDRRPTDTTAACAPAPGWEVVSLLAPHTGTLSVLARRHAVRGTERRFPSACSPTGAAACRAVPTAAACGRTCRRGQSAARERIARAVRSSFAPGTASGAPTRCRRVAAPSQPASDSTAATGRRPHGRPHAPLRGGTYRRRASGWLDLLPRRSSGAVPSVHARQHDREGRADTGRAVERHRAAQLLDEAAHDIEAEAGAAVRARRRAARPGGTSRR